MSTPWYLGNSQSMAFHSKLSLFGGIIPLVIWSAAWTGVALWHAAKREEKGWFVFFLFVHTAGILEILYLIFVAKAFVSKKLQHKKRKKS